MPTEKKQVSFCYSLLTTDDVLNLLLKPIVRQTLHLLLPEATVSKKQPPAEKKKTKTTKDPPLLEPQTV